MARPGRGDRGDEPREVAHVHERGARGGGAGERHHALARDLEEAQGLRIARPVDRGGTQHGALPVERRAHGLLARALARRIVGESRLARGKARDVDEMRLRGEPAGGERERLGRIAIRLEERAPRRRLDEPRQVDDGRGALHQALERRGVGERPGDDLRRESIPCRRGRGAAGQQAHAPARARERSRDVAADEASRAGEGGKGRIRFYFVFSSRAGLDAAAHILSPYQ